MKKAIIVFLVCFMFINCGTTSGGFNNMSSLYSIKTNNVDDIRGQSILTSMLIAKNGSMAGWAWLVSLNKFEQNNQTSFVITVEYNANHSAGWAFIDEFLIRIDEQLFTLKDNNPTRTVISGGVSEIAHFSLNDTITNALESSSSITIQFHGGPNVIPVEGVNSIKNFVSGTL